jgi:hypothetical protein
MKTLFVWVPDDLHSKFKTKVARLGTTAKAVVLSFLRLYVSAGEDEKRQNIEPEKDSKKSRK